MDTREKAQKLAAGAVALATTGLSACDNGGAVDPPPPPFSCDDVGEGETLFATGQLEGTRLHVEIAHAGSGSWTSAEITNVEGATVTGLRIVAQLIEIDLELDSPDTSAGSFTLEGTLREAEADCPVERTFDFTIMDDEVQITLLSEPMLPLAAREPAEIVVLAGNGRRLRLAGRTSHPGDVRLVWSVTGGRVREESGGEVTWELPEEPGFYSIELLAEYGTRGFAADALMFEVG